MGIQVIKYSVFLMILSSCSVLQQEKELYKEVAFCTCLDNNLSKVDSTYSINSIDVSASMILMNESVDPEVFKEVISYTDSITSKLYEYRSHTTSEAGEGSHFISLSCLQYYNSVELRKYINARMKASK